MVVAKANTYKLKAHNLEEASAHGLGTSIGEGLRAISFIEEAPRPADAYYFPLSKDAKGYAPGDVLPTINPTIATNLAFDEDGVWVGTTQTNLWPAKTGSRGWLGDPIGSPLTCTPAFQGILRQNLVKPGGTTVIHSTLSPGNKFVPVVNSWYTVSAYYRQLYGIPTTPTRFSLSKSAGGMSIGRTGEVLSIPTIKEQWLRGFGSAQYTESAPEAWPYITWTAAEAMEARVCGEMLEAKPFVSAFCEDTRGPGALAFNLHISIGLNWDEDYTICYWKKLHGTATDQVVTGYNLDSLGRNSNTVGGGFRRWGKGATDFSFGFTGVGPTFSREDMQYSWVFIALRRLNGTLTLNIYGMGGEGLTSTQAVDDSSAGPDRYVTQNNYDLQLGGWDAANPCNAYYRDLIVLKRALSDEDLAYMYGTKLKVYADSITISSLEEGVL